MKILCNIDIYIYLCGLFFSQKKSCLNTNKITKRKRLRYSLSQTSLIMAQSTTKFLLKSSQFISLSKTKKKKKNPFNHSEIY